MMWEIGAVILIVLLAGAAIGRSIYRAARGETGCNCGAHTECPFKKKCKQERP
jgi:hypothetical protein